MHINYYYCTERRRVKGEAEAIRLASEAARLMAGGIPKAAEANTTSNLTFNI